MIKTENVVVKIWLLFFLPYLFGFSVDLSMVDPIGHPPLPNTQLCFLATYWFKLLGNNYFPPLKAIVVHSLDQVDDQYLLCSSISGGKLPKVVSQLPHM